MPDDAPKKKPWHEILVSLSPLLIGVFVTGGGAYFTKVYNDRQLQLNQLAALDKFRPLLVSENPADREFAYASFAVLGYEQLAVRIINLKRDVAGRAVVQDLKLTGSTDVKASASAALAALPIQVFLHIASSTQEARARLLTLTLEAAGFKAMGVENVTGKANPPSRPQVRYFNGLDKQYADEIRDLLKREGIADAEVLPMEFLKARPGSLEIWFSVDTR